MFKKIKIVTTSAMIALILSNVANVQAKEQEPFEISEDHSEEWVHQTINETSDVEYLIQQLKDGLKSCLVKKKQKIVFSMVVS